MTYTSYKEHYELYTEIHGPFAVNSCQIELAQKDVILLSSISVIFMELVNALVWKRKNLSNLVYLQALIQLMILTQKPVAVLQERQLHIPEHYIFIASDILFITLAILDKHLEGTTKTKSTLPPWLIQNIS